MIFTKRIAIFISAFILSMCLYGVVSSCAASVTTGGLIICSSGGTDTYIYRVDVGSSVVLYDNYFVINNCYRTDRMWQTVDDCITLLNRPYYPNTSIGASLNSSVYTTIVCYSAVLSGINYDNYYGSVDDYLNPTPPETSWWYDMWHDLGEQMGTPEFWFGEWFVGLIDGIFGNDDDTTITDNVTIGIPSLAPTPTPIPYQTIVVPKIDPVTGDTYYTYEYHYNNPSGTPIAATAPPPQPTSATGGGNGGGDYAPINGDPYAMPDLPWLNTTVTIGDDNVDIFDGFGSGLDSIDSVGSEYTEGMNVATNAFGFLPSSWLILIGIGAAIILIAGIISRFLS